MTTDTQTQDELRECQKHQFLYASSVEDYPHYNYDHPFMAARFRRCEVCGMEEYRDWSARLRPSTPITAGDARKIMGKSEAYEAAQNDARLYGNGFIRKLDDDIFEYLPPEEVTVCHNAVSTPSLPDATHGEGCSSSEKEARDDAGDMRVAVTDAITRARQVNWKNGGVLATDADEHIESLLRDIDRIRPRARSASVTDAEKELRDFRVRVFTCRQVNGCDHNTACTIWGDDGKGGTKEGFKEPLPCNCGALANYATKVDCVCGHPCDDHSAPRTAWCVSCDCRVYRPTPPAHGEGELLGKLLSKQQQLESYIAGIDPTTGEIRRHALTIAEGRLQQIKLDIEEVRALTRVPSTATAADSGSNLVISAPCNLHCDLLAVSASRVLKKLESETESVTIFDQEDLAKAVKNWEANQIAPRATQREEP